MGNRSIAATRPATRLVAAQPTLELVCAECGYGVIVRRPPPVCPMCGRHAWEPPVWRPFSRRPGPPDIAA